MASSGVMRLLDHGIPISLLCDLASSADPGSAAINSVERPEGDLILLEAARKVMAHKRAANA
jgi:hypothetical protein